MPAWTPDKTSGQSGQPPNLPAPPSQGSSETKPIQQAPLNEVRDKQSEPKVNENTGRTLDLRELEK
jgi:hypothetical protein